MKFYEGFQKKGEDGRSRWALWASFDIPDKKGGYYLRRLRVVETPWFGVYLHEMRGPDPGRDLHDHPWEFVSVILKGGYTELVPAQQPKDSHAGLASFAKRWDTWKVGSVHYMRATDQHTIEQLLGVPTYTLVLRGRRKRTWGFHTKDGFVPWNEYEGTQ